MSTPDIRVGDIVRIDQPDNDLKCNYQIGMVSRIIHGRVAGDVALLVDGGYGEFYSQGERRSRACVAVRTQHLVLLNRPPQKYVEDTA